MSNYIYKLFYELGKQGSTFPTDVPKDTKGVYTWDRDPIKIECQPLDEHNLNIKIYHIEDKFIDENVDLSKKMYWVVKLIWDHE